MIFKEYTLEEISNFIDYRGKTPNKVDSGIPLITAKLIKGGRISKPQEFIKKEDYDSWMTRGIPKKGAVIITTEAPMGEVAILDTSKKVAFAQRIIVIEAIEDYVLNEYLYYYFQTRQFNHELTKRATGTTVIGIKSKELKQACVKIPSLIDQYRIISILSSFDRKITINDKVIANLEDQARAIFKSWFVDFEPFQDVDFIESELGLIPEGWEIYQLSEKSKRVNGYTYKSKELSDDAHINMLTIKNFNRYGGPPNKAYKPIMKTERMRDHHYLNSGDLLVACTDLTQAADIIGRVLRYCKSDLYDKEIFSMDVIKIIPNDVRDNLYLYFYLKSPLFKDFASSVATGTTVLHLPKKSVDSFKFAYPPASEIDEFTKIVTPMVELQEGLNKQNQTLVQLRDTLLPKLMSGQIDVSDLNLSSKDDGHD